MVKSVIGFILVNMMLSQSLWAMEPDYNRILTEKGINLSRLNIVMKVTDLDRVNLKFLITCRNSSTVQMAHQQLFARHASLGHDFRKSAALLFDAYVRKQKQLLTKDDYDKRENFLVHFLCNTYQSINKPNKDVEEESKLIEILKAVNKIVESNSLKEKINKIIVASLQDENNSKAGAKEEHDLLNGKGNRPGGEIEDDEMPVDEGDEEDPGNEHKGPFQKEEPTQSFASSLKSWIWRNKVVTVLGTVGIFGLIVFILKK